MRWAWNRSAEEAAKPRVPAYHVVMRLVGLSLATAAFVLGCANRATPEPNVTVNNEPRVNDDEQAVEDDSVDGGANADTDADTDVDTDADTDADTGSSDALPPVDGFFMVDGAPPPTGCKVDSDCLGDTIPSVKDPCCQDPYSLRPHARAYRTFVSTWRTEHCAEHECPPPPSPTLPPDCAFDVRCEEGRCQDSC